MNTITIELPLAEPISNSHRPSRFAVHLQPVERDALCSLRAGLTEAGTLVNRRPADSVSAPDLIRYILRRIAGTVEKALPAPVKTPMDATPQTKPKLKPLEAGAKARSAASRAAPKRKTAKA